MILDRPPPPVRPIQTNTYRIMESEVVFRFNCCATCGQGPPLTKPLQRCSGCHVFGFDSRECQIKGWPLHKHECKELGALRVRMETAVPVGAGMNLSEAWMGRVTQTGARSHLADILGALPRCNTCLKTTGLKTCQNCFCAWGCDDHTIGEHSCAQVGTGRLVNMYILQGLEPVLVEGDVAANAALASWADYWKQKPISTLPNDHKMFPVATMITEDALSPAMTIVSCVRRLNPPLDFGKNLVIHFVGSDLGEIHKHARGMEEVMHWLGAEHMTMVFVGPDIPVNLNGESAPMQCCPSCCEKKRTRTGRYATGLYHDLVSTLPKPHVCFAQNSGVHDVKLYPNWLRSVDMMVEMETVAIFTSYTEGERQQDTAVLKQRGAHVLHSAVNEFRTPVVMDDPGVPGSTFQSSHSLTVLDNRKRV